MDPSTPLVVAQGAVITSAVTGIFAGIHGIFKGTGPAGQIGPLAASAGINGGIAGATFFSFREYVVSPVLFSALSETHYARRIRDLQAQRRVGRPSGEKLTWWDMRMSKVPDTAISGALTGGLLNAWKRGRPGIVPGVTTATLVCTFLQLAYNELGITRIKYISRILQSSQTSPSGATGQDNTSTSMAPPRTRIDSEPPRPRMERILTFLGLHQIPDEEYLAMMQKKRDGYLRRIAELEKEREATRASENPLEPVSSSSETQP
ncbi:hypothetical protein B0H21DRAFT_14850 [Amylocystis lapponica]|nr:hypothetical protein B0H21DRAFT_14850 [Amylocystis lapponica]